MLPVRIERPSLHCHTPCVGSSHPLVGRRGNGPPPIRSARASRRAPCSPASRPPPSSAPAGLVVHVEVHVGTGPAGLRPRRPARHRLPRGRPPGQRPRSPVSGPAVAGDTRRVTVNLAPPGVRKLGQRARPRHRRRRARRRRRAAARGGRRRSPSSASSASTARCGRCPASCRWPAPLGGRRRRRARRRARPSATTRPPSRRGRVACARSATLVELLDALARRRCRGPSRRPAPTARRRRRRQPDLADVRGQPLARRALEVAAAGGHHLLLVGPPGAGKTMLAQRLARPAAAARPRRRPRGHVASGRRPASACRRAGSCAGRRSGRRTTARRSRRSSAAARRSCGPGEASCAHRGVLFLDELGEFPPPVLDALRTPLEEGVVRVARARAVGRAAGPVPARRRHEPVPVRRGRAPARAGARRRRGPATSAGSPGRCSTGSTSASRSPGPTPRSCCSAARRRADGDRAPSGSPRPGQLAAERGVARQRRPRRRRARRSAPCPARTPPACSAPPSPPAACRPAASPGSGPSPAPSPTSTARRVPVLGAEHVALALALRQPSSPPSRPPVRRHDDAHRRRCPTPRGVVALAALPEVGPGAAGAPCCAGGQPRRRASTPLAAGAARRPTPTCAAACGRRRPDAAARDRWRRRRPRPRRRASCGRATVAAGVAVLAPGDDRLAAAPSPTIPTRRRSCSPAATSPCSLGDGPRVAVVGTRRCSRYGWDVAHRLGAELAAAGVAVVSGLAARHRRRRPPRRARRRRRGGAAGRRRRHRPRRRLPAAQPRPLGARSATPGVLLSEAPLGTPAEPVALPGPQPHHRRASPTSSSSSSRPSTGGAMHTVDEALRRDRPVLAVPGPVSSPASAGTNRLLARRRPPPSATPTTSSSPSASQPGGRRRAGRAPTHRPTATAGRRARRPRAGRRPPSTTVAAATRARPRRASPPLAALEAAGWSPPDGGRGSSGCCAADAVLSHRLTALASVPFDLGMAGRRDAGASTPSWRR